MLGDLGIHAAAATALFTFLFTGLFGTWLFYRRGSINWRLTLPVCVGAVLFGYLGSAVAAQIPPRALAITIAAIIVGAGAYVFIPPRGPLRVPRDGRGRGDVAMLVAVGAAAGFGSGLSGAGGPLFSVPLMLVLGFAPLATVGASQVLQIVAAVFGTVGNLQFGSIDFATAAWVTVFELAGVIGGARAAHAISIVALRRMTAGLCVVVGVYMLVRSL